ncbi:MAG TPA: CPBP family intramembrane glutamic endopeptidase [Rhabdochlamydiaceae bacterium]|nr:CPBP family intramembrane glutamic endopeptidase [Rhabdochlamydiaceae bacterium]
MAIEACSVAVSSYLLSRRVAGFSSKNAVGFALSVSALTLLLEKIRPKSKETNKWFEFNNNIDCNQHSAKKPQEKSYKIELSSKLINIQVVVNIAGFVWGFFYGICQKNFPSVSDNILEQILDQALITPIIEEVFFRGFLMEWIGVGCDQIDRHIYSISKESQNHISNFVQAILFGAVHMFNDNKIENAFIFAMTGTLGATLGYWKIIEEGGLLTPIKVHSIQDTLCMFTAICLPFLSRIGLIASQHLQYVFPKALVF